MAEKIEMSLDDIIKSNKRLRSGEGGRKIVAQEGQQQQQRKWRSGGSVGIEKGRSRGGISRSYTRGDVNSSWKHDLFEVVGSRKMSSASNNRQTKLIISNLHFGVSDSDIQDLFANLGPIKRAAVHYDRSGRSLGTANVVFEKRSDAINAVKNYNGVSLDGRAMNIQLSKSEIPCPVRKTSGRRVGSKFGNRIPRAAGRARFTMGRPAERRLNSRNQRKLPTAKNLDAELEAYRKEMK